MLEVDAARVLGQLPDDALVARSESEPHLELLQARPRLGGCFALLSSSAIDSAVGGASRRSSSESRSSASQSRRKESSETLPVRSNLLSEAEDTPDLAASVSRFQ